MWKYRLFCVTQPPVTAGQAPKIEATLNTIGQEGWEAVAVVPHSGLWFVLFKAPDRGAAASPAADRTAAPASTAATKQPETKTTTPSAPSRAHRAPTAKT